VIDGTSRRRVLTCFGTGLAVGLAGCSGGGEETTDDGSENESGDSPDNDTPDDTSTGTTDASNDGSTEGSDGMTVDSGPVTGESFRLSNLDPASTTVEFGTEFDISVVVENVSETEKSGTATLLSDGINYSQDVTLDSGGSQTVTFAAVTSTTLGEGTHTYSISIGEATIEGQVTVESPDGGE